MGSYGFQLQSWIIQCLEIPHSGVSVSSLVHLSEERSPNFGNFIIEDTPNRLLYNKEISVHKYFRKKNPKTKANMLQQQEKNPKANRSLSASSVFVLISKEILIAQAEV
ncbi:hypothetical protein DUI87_15876 [Hirundo rustica rustica]|uniref:Uncharacterized protein n=1 Tax=Hirundo rustica rustica TaxID=333673 RepID=A0A3M0JZQ8_HIRRU|nr:hypothetical protein DUI87_15876 [Hirundo rustica rustica]